MSERRREPAALLGEVPELVAVVDPVHSGREIHSERAEAAEKLRVVADGGFGTFFEAEWIQGIAWGLEAAVAPSEDGQYILTLATVFGKVVLANPENVRIEEVGAALTKGLQSGETEMAGQLAETVARLAEDGAAERLYSAKTVDLAALQQLFSSGDTTTMAGATRVIGDLAGAGKADHLDELEGLDLAAFLLPLISDRQKRWVDIF